MYFQRNFIKTLDVASLFAAFPQLRYLDVRRQYTASCVLVTGDVSLLSNVTVRGESTFVMLSSVVHISIT